jgi:hypothetical protein
MGGGANIRLMNLANKKILIFVILLAVTFVGYYLLVHSRHLSIKSAINRGNDTLSGTVTSKFTDCVGGQEMDKQGNISRIQEVSCDGGSTITVDYKDSFVTSTGLVRPEASYSVDVSKIKVGDKVIVHYTTDLEGYKTLNCKSCGVSLK